MIPNNLSSKWTTHPKTLLESLSNIPDSCSQIAISCKRDCFRMSTPNSANNTNEMTMETEIEISVQDFLEYEVSYDSEVVLDTKELKRFLHMACVFNCPIAAKLSSGNSGLIIFELIPAENCIAQFVIASYKSISDSGQTQSIQAKKKRMDIQSTPSYSAIKRSKQNVEFYRKETNAEIKTERIHVHNSLIESDDNDGDIALQHTNQNDVENIPSLFKSFTRDPNHSPVLEECNELEYIDQTQF